MEGFTGQAGESLKRNLVLKNRVDDFDKVFDRPAKSFDPKETNFWPRNMPEDRYNRLFLGAA